MSLPLPASNNLRFIANQDSYGSILTAVNRACLRSYSKVYPADMDQ